MCVANTLTCVRHTLNPPDQVCDAVREHLTAGAVAGKAEMQVQHTHGTHSGARVGCLRPSHLLCTSSTRAHLCTLALGDTMIRVRGVNRASGISLGQVAHRACFERTAGLIVLHLCDASVPTSPERESTLLTTYLSEPT